MPEPVIAAIKGKSGNNLLQIFDTVLESPEFIWTTEMQSELRNAVTLLLYPSAIVTGTSAGPNTDKITPAMIRKSFDKPIEIPLDYVVHYRQIDSELYLGNVYVRLYLKQPTFRLSNPVFFLEKCVQYWESSFEMQVPLPTTQKIVENDVNSRSIVLGKEDFLTLTTSCIVLVLKAEISVLDHVMSWGLPHRLVDFIARCVNTGKRGTPITCCTRIMAQLANHVEIIDNLACNSTDLVLELTRVLDVGNVMQLSNAVPVGKTELPKEASVIVELLKRIFTSQASNFMGYYVASAVKCQLVTFLLEHIISASDAVLASVRSAPALKIHTVDLIKAIIAADPTQTGMLQMMLDAHHNWNEFKEQSHDLFITVSKTNLLFT